LVNPKNPSVNFAVWLNAPSDSVFVAMVLPLTSLSVAVYTAGSAPVFTRANASSRLGECTLDITNLLMFAGLAFTPTREDRAFVAPSRISKNVAILTAPVAVIFAQLAAYVGDVFPVMTMTLLAPRVVEGRLPVIVGDAVRFVAYATVEGDPFVL